MSSGDIREKGNIPNPEPGEPNAAHQDRVPPPQEQAEQLQLPIPAGINTTHAPVVITRSGRRTTPAQRLEEVRLAETSERTSAEVEG
jgi:hypothetical protein